MATPDFTELENEIGMVFERITRLHKDDPNVRPRMQGQVARIYGYPQSVNPYGNENPTDFWEWHQGWLNPS